MNLYRSTMHLSLVLALFTTFSLSQIIHQPLRMVEKATPEQDFINSFKLVSQETNSHDAIYRLALSQDRYKVALFTDVYLGTGLKKEQFMLDTGKITILMARLRVNVDVQERVYR